jgi:hypothetical protein
MKKKIDPEVLAAAMIVSVQKFIDRLATKK